MSTTDHRCTGDPNPEPAPGSEPAPSTGGSSYETCTGGGNRMDPTECS